MDRRRRIRFRVDRVPPCPPWDGGLMFVFGVHLEDGHAPAIDGPTGARA
jgi:hypothetical protein